jgi:hypothetical protein
MKRTQIQLPDPLYEAVKRVARRLDWSVAELLRRGAEYMVRSYSAGSETDSEQWSPPAPLSLGEFQVPVEKWRDVACELESM